MTAFRPQPSPHFSHSEINAIPFNGQQAVTAITALWLWCPTAFRWLQQPIGRHLVIDVAKQVIQRHPEVKNEGIPEEIVTKTAFFSLVRSGVSFDVRPASLFAAVIGKYGIEDTIKKRCNRSRPAGEDATD